MQTLFTLISAALIGGLTLGHAPASAAQSGHGSRKGGHDGSHMQHGGAMIGEPGNASEATRTVAIALQENFFEPETVTVARGETIRFLVTNRGQLVHEFSIGTAEMHAKHQEEMQMMVNHGVIVGDRIDRERMKMDMGGGRTMEHNAPNSILLEPGQTGEVVWKFTEAAELEFACNVPGHYDAGMMGQIRLK